MTVQRFPIQYEGPIKPLSESNSSRAIRDSIIIMVTLYLFYVLIMLLTQQHTLWILSSTFYVIFLFLFCTLLYGSVQNNTATSTTNTLTTEQFLLGWMWSTGSEWCSLSKESSDSGHCGPVERNNLLLEAAAATLAARKQPSCLSWCSFQNSISASFQSQVRLLEALCIGVANVGTGCILMPLLWEC